MYTSESGAKYRKAREPRSRSYPDTDKLYESARKSVGGKVNGEKSSPAKSKAIEKNKAIDKKWAKYNSEKGLTPSGKRKWHNYNTILK